MWDEPNTEPAPRYPNPGQNSGPYQPAPDDGQAGYGQGYGQDQDRYGQGGYGPSRGTDARPGGGAYDPGYGQPPAPSYTPPPPAYPGGRPPQWPGAQPPPSRRDAYPDQGWQAGAAPPGAYPQRPAYAPAPAQRGAAERVPERRRALVGRALPHLPIAHVILVAGLVAMAYAISQQWGTTTAGAPLFVKDFGSIQLNHGTGVDTSGIAVHAATFLVIAAAVLSAVMVLFNFVLTLINKVIGVVGLGGCATLLFFPVLWGAATLLFVVLLGAVGFAGLGALDKLPIVASHSISTVQVQHYALGYYLWCGGAAAVFVGMLGELVMRRR
jgi:hypothetical protein